MHVIRVSFIAGRQVDVLTLPEVDAVFPSPQKENLNHVTRCEVLR